MSRQSIYTVGGTVQAGNGIYIPRKADKQLLALCQAGDFAFVLTPRQMGKSSLVVSTAQRLGDEGIRSVIIDLSGIGVKLTPDAWYLGLLAQIKEALDLESDVIQWWQMHGHLGMTQRFTEFLERVMLVEVPDRVVIFVDEIDTTLSLDFTDDFFAAIRYFYNARSTVPRFKRLSFVLIGVAAPGDLIRDDRRTPFNIGKRVDLTDFTREEALPLAVGLGLPDDQAQAMLARIMSWTSGHPYLTQRLCKALAKKYQPGWGEAEVDALVASTFFVADCEQDNNLLFVRDMLTERAPDKSGVLKTYREIRVGKKPVLDEEQSIIKNHLKLSGVVCRERSGDRDARAVGPSMGQSVLRLRNPIYGTAFDRAWVKEHMPVNWFARARQSGLMIALALLIISFAVSSVWMGKTISQRDRLKAQNAALEAEREQFISQNLSQKANQADPYAGYQIVGKEQSAPEGVDPETPSLNVKERDSKTVYVEPNTGSLSYTLYEDFSIVITRKTPQGGAINTWLPKPPKATDQAPGRLPDKLSRLDDQDSPDQPADNRFIQASFTTDETSPAGTVVGRCVDPHPGQFRSWYGEKNSCWVAVYRQWQDGCTHYQWYNACHNYWDTHPNGAPKVYWTKCVH